MKIGIVGMGFVGSTLSKWLKQNTDHKISAVDIVLDFNDDLSDSDAIFICIPVLSSREGQNHRALERVVDTYKSYTENIFIRSTVLPGTNDKLGTISLPEFFTQRTADQDMERLQIISGPCEENLLRAIFKGKQISMVQNIEAEISKYAHNCFGAMKVTYFNMIRQLCIYNGANFEIVKKSMGITGYIDLENHTTVPGPDGKLGYGGKCFPENMESLIGYLLSNSFDGEAKMIESIIELNKEYRG